MSVELSGVSLEYGDFVAVEDMNLQIPNGQSVALLGQSGCGKTSTMRCIAGLETPSQGTIAIGGKTVFDASNRKTVPPNKRNVGMVFQSYAVWPHRTVLENVMFPLSMKGLKKREASAKALTVLDKVGLAEFAARGASQLSGGQMQRVALARSIAMQPDVLLLDEPLSNLDARLREGLRVELRRIQLENNLTTLYVTHDQHEAFALADQVAIMQHGRITQSASPAVMYREPASATIARFLGVSNIFAARPSASPNSVEIGDGGVLVAVSELAAAEVLGSSVCFRPENVEVVLDPRASAPIHPNDWRGIVRVAVFQGHSIRYQAEIAPGVIIEAVRPASEATLVEPGHPVRLQVDPRHVIVLPENVPGLEVRA